MPGCSRCCRPCTPAWQPHTSTGHPTAPIPTPPQPPPLHTAHLCLRKAVAKFARRQQAQQAVRSGGQHLWLAIAVQVGLDRCLRKTASNQQPGGGQMFAKGEATGNQSSGDGPGARCKL